MKQLLPTTFEINTTYQNNSYFLKACYQMEDLLNKHVQLTNYSNQLESFKLTFTGRHYEEKRITEFKLLKDGRLHVGLSTDHYYYDETDWDTLRQFMIERLLEALLVAGNMDETLKFQQIYNDVKSVFYRLGWFTRVIFPAA